MTVPSSNLFELFGFEKLPTQVEENHAEFIELRVAQTLRIPAVDVLIRAFEEFTSHDIVTLAISINDDEPTSFYSTRKHEFDGSLAQLDISQRLAESGDKFCVEVRVSKESHEGTLSIYSLDAFLSHLNRIGTRSNISIFDKLIKPTGRINFCCYSPLKRAFTTSSISFCAAGNRVNENRDIPRKHLREKRNTVAHLIDDPGWMVTPDDFQLLDDDVDIQWKNLFSTLRTALVFMFLSDHSQFTENDELHCRIQGYRTLDFLIPNDYLVEAENDASFKIYEWTYHGGHISDKVGIVRNILTLNTKCDTIPSLDTTVYQSARSGFEIYLKENVERYLNLKNQVTEHLFELAKDAEDDMSRLTRSLKEALGGFFTFFVAIFIVNSIAGGTFSGIFTTDITILSFLILGASIIYLGVSLFILHRDALRLERRYGDLREQYSDMLDPNDGERVFGGLTWLPRIKGEMKARALGVTIAWLLIVAILGGGTVVLHERTGQNEMHNESGIIEAKSDEV